MLDLSLLVLLTLLALAAWVLNVLGMPGNWVIVAMAAVCWWLVPVDKSLFVGRVPLIAIVAIAVVGEVLEFIAGAVGASRKGGSKRGTMLALAGSVMGAIVGFVVGSAVPPPIVGNVIASLLLGAAGAFAGAIAGERWAGKDWDSSFQIGEAAFWGRLLGTVGKAVCGTVALGVFVVAIWL